MGGRLAVEASAKRRNKGRRGDGEAGEGAKKNLERSARKQRSVLAAAVVAAASAAEPLLFSYLCLANNGAKKQKTKDGLFISFHCFTGPSQWQPEVFSFCSSSPFTSVSRFAVLRSDTTATRPDHPSTNQPTHPRSAFHVEVTQHQRGRWMLRILLRERNIPLFPSIATLSKRRLH